MKYSKYFSRRYISSKYLNVEILKHHANYKWVFREMHYHLSLPFNPLKISKYGLYISRDGSPNEAHYYRPKSDWGIVEPINDPAYLKAVWVRKVIDFDLENMGSRKYSSFKIKPKKHYKKQLDIDYKRYQHDQ